MAEHNETIWDASFDDRVKSYYMIMPVTLLCLTIVGIPIALLYIVIGRWAIQRHLDNLSCVLTDRTLEIKRGIFNKTESTIPLEKITDLQMFQGPIMRHYGLRGFKVETAGQSSGIGSLVSIIGIVDAVDFRQRVLDERDALARRSSAQMQPIGLSPDASHTAPMSAAGSDAQTQLLTEIRDSLARIERTLDSSDRNHSN